MMSVGKSAHETSFETSVKTSVETSFETLVETLVESESVGTQVAMYETYEIERLREIKGQRARLTNELLLLYRTCENIGLWNCATVGVFHRYVLVVGFRYTFADADLRSLEDMCYVYDGKGPKLDLSSYVCSHNEIELSTIERGLPLETIPVEPLLYEVMNIRRELRRLDKMEHALFAYAPGGTAYRKLVRKAAQHGMTRYHLRPRIVKPWRYQ
jgi:hypothetical protein